MKQNSVQNLLSVLRAASKATLEVVGWLIPDELKFTLRFHFHNVPMWTALLESIVVARKNAVGNPTVRIQQTSADHSDVV